MSLLDCVTKLRKDGAITPKQGDDIIKKEQRLVNMYRNSGNYSEADLATKASRDALKGMLDDIKFAKYQEALTVNRVVELRRSLEKNANTENNWKALGGKKKGFDRAMVDELLRTEERGQAINGQAVSQMYDFAEKLRSKVGGGIDKTRLFGGKNNALTREIVKILHGDQGSAEARKFAEMYQKTSDYIFDRKRRAGVNIHKLENFGVPHKWDPFLLKSKGQESFVTDTMNRVDRNRMVAPDGTPLDDDNLKVVLENVYTKLTGGETRKLPLDDEFLSSGRNTSLRSANESSRILHFKSGEDWLQMHDTYGAGDIFENMLSEINRSSHDIAIFERFGPNPNKVFNSLQIEKNIHNQKLRDLGQDPSVKKLLGTPEQMWKVLTGSESDLVDPIAAETFAALRNFQASAKLGSAVLSNLTDQAFALQQLHRWGGSYTSYVHKFFRQLRPGNQADRKLAAEMLLGLEWTYNAVSSANRHGDVAAIGRVSGIAKAAADFTVRTSGLSTLNRASRSAAGLELNTTLAKNASSDWGSLNPKIKLGLESRGIDSSDWNLIRSTILDTNGGVKYIDMQRLLAKDEGVSTKLTAVFHEFIRKAAPEPDLQARSIVTGGGAPKGSLLREGTANFLQFKTFPITVLIQNLRDQMFDPRLASFSSRISDAAKLTVYASLIGGGVVQLKNIANGRDFEDPFTLEFFIKSILQGGSFGIIGDAVSQASDQDRGRVAEQILGPVVSMALDVTTGLAGASNAVFDGNYDKIGKDVIRKINNQTPGRTFYTKLAVERLIYDQLEDLARPNSYLDWQRYQRSLNKRTGQGFWWKQGETLPQRLPEVAEKP